MESYTYPDALIYETELKDKIRGAGHQVNRALFWALAAMDALVFIGTAFLFLNGGIDPRGPLIFIAVMTYLVFTMGQNQPIRKVSFDNEKLKVEHWVPASETYKIAKLMRFRLIGDKELKKGVRAICEKEGLFCFKIYYPTPRRSGPDLPMPLELFLPLRHKERIISLLSGKSAPEKELEEMIG
ncbi:MAG: hypothetical protein WC861_00600 [Candidatus Micrarchaeia archaeon]|jgi:hypothetical protein